MTGGFNPSSQQPPVTQTPWPPPQRRAGRFGNGVVLGFVAAAVLALAGIGAYFAITHFAKARSFTIDGTMTLYADGDTPGPGCRGAGGYSDIGPGTAVTVSDEAGTLLAKSTLSVGTGADGSCTMPFTVRDVPGGKKFYKIEVSHRGEVSFTESEAKAGVVLQLGDSNQISKPTTAPTRTPVAPPPAAAPPPSATTLSPGRNGMVYIITKSGKTRCQIMRDEVDCQAPFTNTPYVNGYRANGIRFMDDGTYEWVSGDLGDIPVVQIGYQTYQALDWTILATKDGTSFTNNRTGNGVFVSIDKITTH